MPVADFLRKYHQDVLHLGSVATHLAKLRKHSQDGTYPTALHSIKEPRIQWSHEMMTAPSSDRHNFAESERSFMGFAEICQMQVTDLKKSILKAWIADKERELSLFQRAAHASTAVINLRLHLEERMTDLRSRFCYTSDGKPRNEPFPPAIQEILDTRVLVLEVLFRMSPA